MRKMRTLAVLLTLLALLGSQGVRAADDRPRRPVKDKLLQKRIDKAIAKGVAYLKTKQRKDGSWPYTRFGGKAKRAGLERGTGGLTALALYALAASGVPERDKTIQAGLKWTVDNPKHFGPKVIYSTYSASLLVLALTRINEQKHRTTIHRHAESLVKSQLGSDMWTYLVIGYARKRAGTSAGGYRMGDNSNSQFAILALWAAYSMTDYRVPQKTWKRIRDLYKTTQLKSGAWAYIAAPAGKKLPRMMMGRPSMTAAGLVAYVYARAALDGSEAALAKARKSRVAKAGLKALMGARRNYADYYFAYAMERVGTVMDLPLADWYLPGAKRLCNDQRPDGSWPANAHGDENNVYSTSLALLFLSRGTLPPRRGTFTVREKFPDLSKPDQLKRGFDFYHAYKPNKRATVLAEFGKAGPGAIGYFVERLKDDREATRKTAFELLTKLLEKRFFFEPRWPPADRAVMLAPIEKFWKQHGVTLRWNTEKQRFVLP